MLEINLSIILFACIIYYLSYISPRSDLFLYGISATLFLIAGVSGYLGFSDVVISYTTQTISGIITTVPIYSKSIVWNHILPLLEVLISLYMFIMLTQYDRRTTN